LAKLVRRPLNSLGYKA